MGVNIIVSDDTFFLIILNKFVFHKFGIISRPCEKEGSNDVDNRLSVLAT